MEQYELKICNVLNKAYRLKLEDANFAKGFIPQKILIDKSRCIHSYFVLCKDFDNKLESKYWTDDDFENNLKSLLAVQYSNLDRPMFFIFYKDESLMIIEGQQIRDYLFDSPGSNIYNYIINNSDKISDVITKIYKEL